MPTRPVTSEVSLMSITMPWSPDVFSQNGMEVEHTHKSTNVIEFAGRGCYQSFNKPNAATRKQEDYIKNIIEQKHFSVLEHVQCSFYLTGISRNFTHELVRHRHFSFSELSGRYVDPLKNGLGYVVPPMVRDDSQIENIIDGVYCQAEDAYEAILKKLEENGITGKKAREAARSVMPGSLETRIVVSGNLRSWMEFVSKRDHEAADAEMQEVAGAIYRELMCVVPEVFAPEVREEWDEQFCQRANSYDLGPFSFFKDPKSGEIYSNPMPSDSDEPA